MAAEDAIAQKNRYAEFWFTPTDKEFKILSSTSEVQEQAELSLNEMAETQ